MWIRCSIEELLPAYIKGQSNAPSAETLMRSRYVAYCLNEEQYLKPGFIWMQSGK